jgi:uncharacterized membrane protein YgcG
LTLLFVASPQELAAAQDTQDPAQTEQNSAQAQQAPAYTQQSAQQLQQLVAPIALYPDSLTAQVLAASAFPDQVVQADGWVRENAGLKGDDLGRAVDQQPWDPSVKALTAFPSVLGNMAKNISWTSSLGDAYYNQQQDVMDAVQEMRHRAQRAGHLNTTSQQVVTADGNTIVIAPGNPNVVYVPQYDPWMIYGGYMSPWPGWYRYPGIYYGGPYISFGMGFGVGFYSGYGWGYPRWGFNWNNHYAMYNNGRYYAHGHTYYGGNNRYGVSSPRGGYSNRATGAYRPYNGNRQATRGYVQPRNQGGARPSAGRTYQHGGQTANRSSRSSGSNSNRPAHSSGGNGAARGGGTPRGGGAAHSNGGDHK